MNRLCVVLTGMSLISGTLAVAPLPNGGSALYIQGPSDNMAAKLRTAQVTLHHDCGGSYARPGHRLRLLRYSGTDPWSSSTRTDDHLYFSYPMYRDLRDDTSVFSS